MTAGNARAGVSQKHGAANVTGRSAARKNSGGAIQEQMQGSRDRSRVFVRSTRVCPGTDGSVRPGQVSGRHTRRRHGGMLALPSTSEAAVQAASQTRAYARRQMHHVTVTFSLHGGVLSCGARQGLLVRRSSLHSRLLAYLPCAWYAFSFSHPVSVSVSRSCCAHRLLGRVSSCTDSSHPRPQCVASRGHCTFDSAFFALCILGHWLGC